jgi:glutamine---fructose-6-phosphate transaminase (isomerizing)
MSQFYYEVKQQPQAIRSTLESSQENSWNLTKPLLFTGMGSSLYAAEIAAAYLRSKGITANAADNSELLYYYDRKVLDAHHVIAVSQSGESYEAKKLCEEYPEIYGVTNTPESTLSKKSRGVFYTKAGEEKAIASSKSFTTTAALLLNMAAQSLSDQQMQENLWKIPERLASETAEADSVMQTIGDFINPERPLMLLGRGPGTAIARQSALTLKETARMFAEGMSAPMFRHGPLELLEEGVQAVFFNPQGRLKKENQNYVKELAEKGARVLYIADEPLNHRNIQSIRVESTDEFTSTLSHTYVMQLAAVVLAEKRGLVAGEAALLKKITDKQ